MTPEMKHRLEMAGIATVIFVGGAAAVRYGLPAQVVVQKESTHTETVKAATYITQQVDIQQLMKQLTDMMEKKNVVTKRTIVREGGKETVTEVVTDLTETHTKSDVEASNTTKATTNLKLLEEKLVVDHSMERTTTTYGSHTWVVGAQVGYHLPSLLGANGGPSLLPVKGMIVGLSVDRHILGPVYLGVWGTTRMDAGVSLKIVY